MITSKNLKPHDNTEVARVLLRRFLSILLEIIF